MMSNLLQFVGYKDLANWSAKTSLNLNIINSSFSLTSLENLIKPRQEKVKKADYKNDVDLVKKISFKDGVIHLRSEKKSGMDMYKLHPEDLLVSKINFHQGALAINNFGTELLTSTHYQPYIVNNIVDKKYLTLVLRSNAFQRYLSSIKSEGIKTEATYNFIKTLKIPLPLLKIQQQIVNNYQAKLTLSKQQEQDAQQKEVEIEAYLYQALGIELPKAEQQNTDLLQFVRFKDIDRWDLDYFRNKLDANIVNFNLISYGELFETLKNGADYRKYTNNGVNFIRVGNIKNMEINFFNSKKISIFSKKYLIKDNTLLITRKGSVGRSVFYEGGKKFVASSEIFIIDLDLSIINPYYFLIMNESSFIQKQYQDKYTGMTMPNITHPNLKSIQIPLPPLKIQNQIADYTQNLKQEITTLKQNAQENKQSALSDFEAEIFNAS